MSHVKIGNPWGISRAAQAHADRFLALLTTERWAYYIEECLPADKDVLAKLADSLEICNRWVKLAGDYNLTTALLTKSSMTQIMLATERNDPTAIRAAAKNLLRRLSR